MASLTADIEINVRFGDGSNLLPSVEEKVGLFSSFEMEGGKGRSLSHYPLPLREVFRPESRVTGVRRHG
jgi:hypothetical protein